MKNMKLAFFTLALVASVNVFAHGMMTMTYPKDGAMLMAQAERVELNFQNPMKVVSLKVVGSQGKPVSVRFDRDGATAKSFQTMLPMLAPDSYTVHWKAMGEDGHMMKGSYSFMQH
jgi:methionine-rich copper-binding protein CopC